eukprot:364883_1
MVLFKINSNAKRRVRDVYKVEFDDKIISFNPAYRKFLLNFSSAKNVDHKIAHGALITSASAFTNGASVLIKNGWTEGSSIWFRGVAPVNAGKSRICGAIAKCAAPVE